MLSYCVLSKNLLGNITCLFIYLFIYYLEYLLIYLILVLISIITILMCLISRIYYGSPILLLSFYCATAHFVFLM